MPVSSTPWGGNPVKKGLESIRSAENEHTQAHAHTPARRLTDTYAPRSSFHSWERGGPVRASDVLKVTQQASGRTGPGTKSLGSLTKSEDRTNRALDRRVSGKARRSLSRLRGGARPSSGTCRHKTLQWTYLSSPSASRFLPMSDASSPGPPVLG